MKQLIAFLFIFFFLKLSSQNIDGQWYGALNIAGTQLRIVVNISKTTDGYACTLDSPDQGAKGIPVASTTFENGLLHFKVNMPKLEYKGEWKDGKIIGKLYQGGQEIPLDLGKEEVKTKPINRPQTPSKPYPYYTEEVKFENTAAKVTLAGSLTLPAKEGSYPVVVLISGSGPQDRDEELFNHRPFLVIADYFTKQGIGVLRYDDRGYKESTGDFRAATSADFASDVLSAVKFLKARKEVKQIGLVGHSEGGLIAPMVASKNNNIDFIVLMAGPGISGSDILILQQELISRASGISEAEIVSNKKINTEIYNVLKKSKNDQKLRNKIETLMKKSGGEKVSGEEIKKQVDQITGPWFFYFLKHDPKPYISNVKCPVLAVNGGLDLQVPADINLNAIKKYLDKAKNKNVMIKKYEGLNHLFQETKTGSPEEYGAIEQTIAPQVLEDMARWILNIINK
jgi:uncharacterized protein